MTITMSRTAIIPEGQLDLITRCKAGDAKACKELYEAYATYMYNLSARMLNDANEAQDILQESFIAAFNNLQKFEAKSTFGAWLKRIVINKSIDALKQRKMQFLPLSDSLVDEEVDESGVSYDISNVNEAMLELPDGFRLIVTLYLFEGYSHRQIAEELNISEGTSKSQYSRGKQKLVELIKQVKNEGHE